MLAIQSFADQEAFFKSIEGTLLEQFAKWRRISHEIKKEISPEFNYNVEFIPWERTLIPVAQSHGILPKIGHDAIISKMRKTILEGEHVILSSMTLNIKSKLGIAYITIKLLSNATRGLHFYIECNTHTGVFEELSTTFLEEKKYYCLKDWIQIVKLGDSVIDYKKSQQYFLNDKNTVHEMKPVGAREASRVQTHY